MFSADYGYRARASSNDVGLLTRQTVGGGLTHSLGKGLAATAGYHYMDGRYEAEVGRFTNHLIDAGVDFNRNLSFSRRTTLSFGTGTTATVRPNDTATRTRFHLNAHAALNHEMGRTWNASLDYSRGVQFHESWPEPVSFDLLTARVGGQLSRRLQFQSSANGSKGRAVYAHAGGAIEGYYAMALLGYDLSQHLSLNLKYAYYHHRFEDGTLAVPGYPDAANRHSVRGFVSLWAPLFQRARRADVTR